MYVLLLLRSEQGGKGARKKGGRRIEEKRERASFLPFRRDDRGSLADINY